MMGASDLHYLSPQLMEYSGKFREMCEAIGEPEMERIESLTDDLLDSVFREKPDVFLITGDLSYQGEKMSHIHLAEKLNKLVEAGIPVYVVPGNQDLENAFSMCWRTEGEEDYTLTESVTSAEFERIYNRMGYDQGDSRIISRAPDSLSYQVCLRRRGSKIAQPGLENPDRQGQVLYLFMLDTTISQSFQGQVARETLIWLEERLKKMEEHAFCLIAGHHPVVLPGMETFQENGGVDSSASLRNGRELGRLMWKYRVPYYISGHLHQAGTAQVPGEEKLLQKWIRRLIGTQKRQNPPVNIFLEKRGLRNLP